MATPDLSKMTLQELVREYSNASRLGQDESPFVAKIKRRLNWPRPGCVRIGDEEFEICSCDIASARKNASAD
jgi:hypothetical protein